MPSLPRLAHLAVPADRTTAHAAPAASTGWFSAVSRWLRAGTALAWLVLLTACASKVDFAMSRGEMAPDSAAPTADVNSDKPLGGAGSLESQPAVDPSGALPIAGAPPAGRVLIYTADLTVVVLNVESAVRDVDRLAREAGGYMVGMTADSITVRVPASKFRDALDAAAKLGVVVKRSIEALDVTTQLRDLDIQLANAERTRERLLKLLEKSDRVEDTLRIESELLRLTTTIEKFKAELASLRERIAFSTLTVRFNSPVRQDELRVQVPFPWVRELGAEFIAGAQPARIETGFLREGIDFDVPSGFVKHFETRDQTRAMSADGVQLKAAEHDNYKGGELAFWAKLVRRSLTESRAIVLDPDQSMQTREGRDCVVLSGRKEIAGKAQAYFVALVVIEKRVYAIEAWGEKAAFDAERAKLLESVRSLDVGW